MSFYFHALEKEMATHSSVLAWRVPGTGEPDELPSMGSHRVGHDWSDLAVAVAEWKLLSSFYTSKSHPEDLPVVKHLPANAGDMVLVSGPGKIPHATGQLSPHTTPTEATHTTPMLCSKRSHHNEKPSHRS